MADKLGIIVAVLLVLMVVAGIIGVDFGALLNRPVTCSTCKKRIDRREAKAILHGMGPESDCWTEWFCQECPAKETLLTRHRIQ